MDDNIENIAARGYALNAIATVAHKWHSGHFRRHPDCRPYIVHPKAVYEMLIQWGFDDVVILCIAWCHDLLEEARPDERESISRDIVVFGGRWGSEILDGVVKLSLLVPDEIDKKEYYRRKREYLKDIAETAKHEHLAVKIADRLCNTIDFAKNDKIKARRYLDEGACLFSRLCELPNHEKIKNTLNEVYKLLKD